MNKELERSSTLGAIQFAAFDLETTGMDPLTDEIIEIGITVFRQGEVLQNFDHLVNPRVPVSNEAFEVHGISTESLKDKPRVEAILPEAIKLLAESVPVAHNAPFDVSFLVEAARKHDVPFPPRVVVDSCQMARKLFPDFSTHRLSFLAEQFGIKSEKAHRALNDAQSCHSLFCREVEALPSRWDTSWGDFLSSVPGVLSLNGEEFPYPESLAPYKEAFNRHDRLIFSYRDGKGEVTEREVTPMGFTSDGNKKVLVGYCHLRRGTRSFRLDRIMKIEISRLK